MGILYGSSAPVAGGALAPPNSPPAPAPLPNAPNYEA